MTRRDSRKGLFCLVFLFGHTCMQFCYYRHAYLNLTIMIVD